MIRRRYDVTALDRRRSRGPRRLAALRTASALSFITLLLMLLVPAPLRVTAGAVELFPATDVVLVVDVSAGMGLPTELPSDFPNRERYTREIAQLLEAFHNLQSTSSPGASPTPAPSVWERAKGVADAGRWLAELTAFQRDVESYSKDQQIDAASLTRLASEQQAVRRVLNVLAASSQADGTTSRVGLVAYAANIVTTVPLSDDQDAVLRALSAQTADSGTADLTVGLTAAIEQFSRATSVTKATKQIVLMSGSPAVPDARLDQVAGLARQRGIAVDTIGVGPSATTVGQEALVSVARATGGGYLFASSRDAVSAATVGLRSYANSNVLSRGLGAAVQGQALREKVVVPSGSNVLRVTISELDSVGASSTARGTTALPTADRARATAALPTAPASPRALEVGLIDPSGARIAMPEGSSNRVVIGSEEVISVPTPGSGEWQVEVRLDPAATSTKVPLAWVAAVDGASASRPIDLAPPGAGAAAPPPSKLADDPRVQVALWIVSAVLAVMAIVLLALSVRGLTRSSASTPLGCAFGCLAPLLLILLAAVWAFVRFFDLFAALLRR